MGKGTGQVEFAQRVGRRPAPERASRLKRWRVVRYVREEFEVQASTRSDALMNISDPHTVTVTRETCSPVDEQ